MSLTDFPQAPAGAGLDAETLTAFLDTVREFVTAALPDERILELDHEDVCPEDLVRGLCSDRLGVHLLFVPEEYGGLGGGAFDVYRVCEQMARLDLGLATSVLATFLGSDPIVVGATEEQRRLWLTRIAEQGTLFAYGATEPDAGSDLAALRTTATPVVEDGRITGYRITGAKQWISNGGIADACTVLARTPGGPSWFVVERGAEGFTSDRPEDKHGIRLSNTAALHLDDVLVAADRLVGGVEGQGLVQAQQVFGYTRLMVAAFGLGGGWAALDRAIRYSTERIQAGTPLSQKQGYTHKLVVPHVCRLEAARAVIEETALRLDAGDGAGGALNTEGAIAKYVATEAGNAAADAAIQAHGGYGYTREYLVEKIRRDVRITTIYEGTSEIMEMTIARERWQQHLKSRGEFYRERGRELDTLHARRPEVGADTAALAARALAAVFEACRVNRLTRNQHVLFRLGSLAAATEAAAAMSRRAAAALDSALPAKTDHRFPPDVLAATARVVARDAAGAVADDGGRWVRGSVEPGTDLGAFEAALALPHVQAAQAGLVADCDRVADALYGRA